MTIHPNTPTLIYNGELIRDRSETLCLTDMWKAAGADPARQPSNWLASADARRFIEVLSEINPRNSGDDLVTSIRGGKAPGTWAHWQIGLAYAKYLSPEFHMWCNQVVRERMEGKSQTSVAVMDESMKKAIGGIVKSCAGVVIREEIGKALAEFRAQHVHPTFDLAGTVTADQIIDMAGVAKRERVRGTSVMVTSRLLSFCDGVGCFRTPDHLNASRPWRFPREKAHEWLFGMNIGSEQIRHQIRVQQAKRARKAGKPELVEVYQQDLMLGDDGKPRLAPVKPEGRPNV